MCLRAKLDSRLRGNDDGGGLDLLEIIQAEISTGTLTFLESAHAYSPMPAITMAEPIASAIVKGSPKIHTAKTIVMSGEMVAIMLVVWGVVLDNPAFTRNDGMTVAKIAVPAESQKNLGDDEKSKLRLTTI